MDMSRARGIAAVRHGIASSVGSDDAGHQVQCEAGRLLRSEVGQGSDLKPDISGVARANLRA